jgi:hypothetical protein
MLRPRERAGPTAEPVGQFAKRPPAGDVQRRKDKSQRDEHPGRDRVHTPALSSIAARRTIGNSTTPQRRW